MLIERTLGAGRRLVEAGLLLVLPLLFWRSFTEPFTTPKMAWTEALVAVSLTTWALALACQRTNRPTSFPLGAPLLLLSLAVVLSCLNSPSPLFSLREADYFLCGPAWVLLLVCGPGEESVVLRLARFAAAAGAVVSAITCAQWAGCDPLLLAGMHVELSGMVARMRLYSTFGNPNFVAGYLIGVFFPAVALAINARRYGAKAAWWVTTGVILAAIVGTASHGAWFALGVGLIVAGIVWRSGSRTRSSRVSVTPGGAEEVAKAPRAMAVVLLFSAAPGLALALNLASRLWRQSEGRVYLWRVAWPMLGEHPVLGGGWATVQLRFLELQARFLAAHPNQVRHWSNIIELHNDPLQVLLEAGLVGAAALLWLLWVYARTVRRLLVRGDNPTVSGSAPIWLAASAGGVTAILVNSLFNYQFAVPPTFILLFTLLAFPVLLDHRDPIGVAAPSDRRFSLRHKPSATLTAALVSLAVLAAAIWLLVGVARHVAAEWDYYAGFRVEDDDLKAAETLYRRGLAHGDINGRLRFGLGRVLYLEHEYPEALAEVQLAARTYADSHLEVLRGRIQEEMGLRAEALATYRHALALDPTLTSVEADIASSPW